MAAMSVSRRAGKIKYVGSTDVDFFISDIVETEFETK